VRHRGVLHAAMIAAALLRSDAAPVQIQDLVVLDCNAGLHFLPGASSVSYGHGATNEKGFRTQLQDVRSFLVAAAVVGATRCPTFALAAKIVKLWKMESAARSC